MLRPDQWLISLKAFWIMNWTNKGHSKWVKRIKINHKKVQWGKPLLNFKWKNLQTHLMILKINFFIMFKPPQKLMAVKLSIALPKIKCLIYNPHFQIFWPVTIRERLRILIVIIIHLKTLLNKNFSYNKTKSPLQ